MGSINLDQEQPHHIDPKLRQGLKLDGVIILPKDGEAICNGQRKHIPPKAMEILLFLCQHNDQLVTTEQLLEFGWGDKNGKRSKLTHAISEIRHALDDHKECPEFIQTMPRRGYRLIASLSLLDDKILYPNVWPIKSDALAKSDSKQNSSNHWHLSLALLKNSKLFSVSIAFVVSTWVTVQVLEVMFPIFDIPEWGLKIVVLFLVVGFPLALLYTWLREIKVKRTLFNKELGEQNKKIFFRQLALDFGFIGVLSIGVGFLALYLIESIELDQLADSDKFTTATVEVPTRDNLMAVLPFQIDTRAKLPDYFQATFHGELVSTLNRQSHFSVVSQWATSELPADSTLNDYVQKLGARFLLGGKIAGNRDEFSIVLNLTDAVSSLQVWSTTIKGELSNLLSAQEDLYRQLFNALAMLAEHQPDENNRIISTQDFKAYDHYIQAKNKLSAATTDEELISSERHFLTALSIDPDFSLASAGLCQTYLDQYQMSRRVSAFEAAKMQCGMLLQDQSTSSPMASELKVEALVSLANLNRVRGNQEEAIQFYQSALEFKPDSLPAIVGLAQSKQKLGNSASAEELLLKAIKLEPGYWKNYLSLGDFLFDNGKYAQASVQYVRVVLLKPNNQHSYNRLGASYFLNYQLEKAAIAWQKSLEIKPSANIYTNLGTALFISQEFTAARQSYQQAIQLKPADPVLWGNLGDAEKFSGDLAAARKAYRKAVKLSQNQLKVNSHDPALKSMLTRYQSELSQCDDSMLELNRLATVNSTDPYVYYDLSIAALNCNRTSQARQLIQRALNYGYSLELLSKDIQFERILPAILTNQSGLTAKKGN